MKTNQWARRAACAGVALVSTLAATGSIAQTTNSLVSSADTFVRFGVNQNVNYGTANYLDLYANGTARDYFGYVRFDLSTIPLDAVVTGATLTFTKVDGLGSTRSDGITTARFRVLGLNNVAGNTPQDWSETGLTFDTRGSEWTAANTFDAARVTDFDGALGNESVSGSASGSTASISGNNLVLFINGFLSSGAVTFIADQAGTDAGRGYGLATREYGATSATAVPTLTLVYTVPEPSSLAVLGLGGFLIAVARRKNR
ncbi:MAG TPA: DNRLRE domain-containing protein [Candidatus Paceibacterota bacterium]|nr:DNRLRE domain-containing protein [Candidatus Paceibacterota bacterium]